MTSDDFIKLLREYYPTYNEWQNNIQKAIDKVGDYLEDGFWNNHFTHFYYKDPNKDSSIKYEAYNKFHQGMWHLHVANFLVTAGYSLEKPRSNSGDDIVAIIDQQKIYVECGSPGWGHEDNPIRKTFSAMSREFTEIDHLSDNFIYKLLQTINDKEKQIKKRKLKNSGVYMLAINEGLLMNGCRDWNLKNPEDRFNQVIAGINSNAYFDAIIYGCVFESEYCQPSHGLMMIKTINS